MDVLFSNPKTWIVLAFVLLVAALYKKIAAMLAKVLDERSAKIAEELAAAQKLRKEAEAVLALYKQKQTEYTKEAQEILAKARHDADLLAAHADKELKAALDSRMEHALEKIAQEEARAINEVREHIVDIALAAARTVVIKQIESTPQQELLALALADIDRKIH
ncbi:MAG: F0F1 ATP synthase subunit B [Alphaproteobacteria bacterium]|nr:F0F1 ATP synthase subunit B [Alphaproteobacteria bacterium]